MAKSKASKLKAQVLNRFPKRWRITIDRIRKAVPGANEITEVYLVTEAGNVFLTARGKDYEAALQALEELTLCCHKPEGQSA